MKRFRRNDGFTLVELMVTILVGSIVTLAATTVLLLGLRINKKSSETAIRQNTSRIIIAVLEDVAAEGDITIKENSGSWQILNEDNKVRFYYNNGTIYTGEPDTGTALMEDVSESSITLDGNLFTIVVKTEDDGEYESSVYCRAGSSNSEEMEGAFDVSAAISAADSEVQPFLNVLKSQIGSKGEIIGGTDGYQYYSEWYLEDKGYVKNPGWSSETPWCVCFISWAIAQVDPDAEGFANVDSYWAEFVTTGKWENNPAVGNIIFFDWIVDSEDNPQHAGVVLQVKDGYIYTIEGNTDGVVAVRKYAADDERILGYGVLNWS